MSEYSKYTLEELIELKKKINQYINDYTDGYFYACNKLKYGHRAHNHPVQLVGTDTCYITSQNHGFVLDTDSLSNEWEPLFINLNDNTNEGIRHKTKPFFSTQFHPEASSGPTDTEFLFDKFIGLIQESKRSK